MRLQEVRLRFRLQRHAVLSSVILFFSGFILVLSGCSSSPAPPSLLPELHAPGLVRLDSFAHLEVANSNHTVNSLLTYNPVDEPGVTRLLILQGVSLYDASLASSGTIRVIQAPACYRLGGIDQKSRQVLCQGKQDSLGIIVFHPDAASSVWPGRLLISGSAPNEGYSSPTWSPDGRILAVVRTKDSKQDIVLFAIDATQKSVQAIAALALPQPSHPPYLMIQWLSWSPDGAWLAFAGGVGRLDTTYGLHISSLLAQLPASHGTVQEIAVTHDQLLTLIDHPIIGQAWQPGGSNLVYLEGERLTELNMVTKQRRVLLTIPDGNLCGLTWTPDGHRLIFAHCRYVSTDSIPPPAQIYVYTMP